MFDDFDTQIQSDEIIPEEYDDWVRFCAGAYEVSEQEKYDVYEVDCDDGTHGDVIYVPRTTPFWSKAK